MPCTLIGRTNMTLMQEALRILTASGETPGKFALNGDGENSGRKAWLKTLKLIESCYDLFLEKAAHLKQLREFEDEDSLSWEEFERTVRDRELSQHQSIVNIITRWKHDTMDVVAQFKAQVVDNPCRPDEAHVILTTAHSAKGMEWDRVVLCDDFSTLAAFKMLESDSQSGPAHRRFQKASQIDAESPRVGAFDLKPWGDDINLWGDDINLWRLPAPGGALCYQASFESFWPPLTPSMKSPRARTRARLAF